MTENLRVGAVTSVHGLKGEVKVFPFTDSADCFKKIKQVKAVRPGVRLQEGGRDLKVESVRFFKNMVIVHFEGTDSPEEAQKLIGFELWVKRLEAPDPGENRVYTADLVGLKAVDENGTEIGTVRDIMEAVGNDLYVVEREGKEVLIPNVPVFIRNIDFDAGTVTIHVIPGLLN